MRRKFMPPVTVINRADHAGLHASRSEHRLEQVGDCRFAIRPRHADELELTAGPSEKLRRPQSHSPPDVSYSDCRRSRWSRFFPRHHNGGGTALEGLANEIMSVDSLTRNRKEDLTRGYLSRVVDESTDVLIQVPFSLFHSPKRQKLLEAHGHQP